MSRHMKLILQLAAISLSFVALTGCGATCGNEVSQAISSPSGHARAVVFNRDCGATTGFNTQVSIVSGVNVLSNDEGNALILAGTIPLQIQWESDSVLRLDGLGSAKVFKQETLVAGVAINYGD